MKNNLIKALTDDNGSSLFLVSAAQLKEFALFIVEETKTMHSQSLSDQDSHDGQSMETQDKELMTADEVCVALKVSQTTLWRWSKTGYLMPVKVGGQRRYSVNDVRRLMPQDAIVN